MRILIICGLTALQVAARENSWKTEPDNGLVRVSRPQIEARETVAAAEMPATLLVFLTDYSVRVSGAFIYENLGQRHEVLRLELKAGAGDRE
jgi:hypothetical protein